MGRIFITSPGGAPEEYDEDELRTIWERGKLQSGTFYWKEGMPDWMPLAGYFAPAEKTTRRPATVPLPEKKAFTYTKNPESLTRLLVVILYLVLAMHLANIISNLLQLEMVSRTFSQMEATANNTRQHILGYLYNILRVANIIILLMWVYRANVNSRGFGAQGMKFTPGWSVGYFFIPILNLFKPYQVMKEIWQVSVDPHRWDSQETSAVLEWWWTLVIASVAIGRVASRFVMKAATLEEIRRATLVSILPDGVGILSCLVAIALIKRIAENQGKLVKRVS